MKNLYLTKEEFKHLKTKNKFSEGTEGKLYLYNNSLVKIYRRGIIENREEIIDYILTRDKINGCVLPNRKVYIQDEFKGITMDYYHNYKTLFKLINDKSISYKERLEICKEIIESVKTLHNNEIVHGDINLSNVIVSSDATDNLLIDIDGGLPKEIMCLQEFKNEIKNDQYTLMLLVMSLVYDFRFERYIYNYGINNFKEILTSFSIGKDLKNYIIRLINGDNCVNEYIDEYLGDMKENKSNKVIRFL